MGQEPGADHAVAGPEGASPGSFRPGLADAGRVPVEARGVAQSGTGGGCRKGTDWPTEGSMESVRIA